MSYVYFKNPISGYLPTDLSNWHKKYISFYHDYGIYLNEDPGITQKHIEVFNYCGESKLKEIYEKQGKPHYYVFREYPNAPFIVFKRKKKKEERLKVRND